MNAESLISRLDHLLPGFRAYAESEASLFDPGSAHGIFAACSNYVSERTIPPGAWQPLAEIVNQVVGSSDADLDNAACTCFLENLAQPGHPLACHLRGNALAYWEQWAAGA